VGGPELCTLRLYPTSVPAPETFDDREVAERILPCDMSLTAFASLVLPFGFINGLRTLVPVASLCWGAHFHWFSFGQTPFAFLANPISLGVFSALAVGELIGDKLPKTPARIAAFPLAGRTVFGAGCGAALATLAGVSPVLGGALGGLGAVVGAYAGFLLRRSLTKNAGLPDLPVALVEDAIAIGGACFIASRF
jgi:uncharacterized membrane protein